jgi:hypothetical protein
MSEVAQQLFERREIHPDDNARMSDFPSRRTARHQRRSFVLVSGGPDPCDISLSRALDGVTFSGAVRAAAVPKRL